MLLYFKMASACHGISNSRVSTRLPLLPSQPLAEEFCALICWVPYVCRLRNVRDGFVELLVSDCTYYYLKFPYFVFLSLGTYNSISS